MRAVLTVSAVLVLLAVTWGAAEPVQVQVDIKPQSCPNPLNVKSRGILTAAILGAEAFDVNTVDTTSVMLAGVAAIRCSTEDVAAPVAEPGDCRCTDAGPDGFMDLVLKFNTPDIAAALGPVNDGDQVVVSLTGSLTDGTVISGSDCVVIIKKGMAD